MHIHFWFSVLAFEEKCYNEIRFQDEVENSIIAKQLPTHGFSSHVSETVTSSLQLSVVLF